MPSPEHHDLVVVGGGPAGLSAAITAESERIDTIVLDMGDKLGGQAGSSTFIENYPGFPRGVTGDELTAGMVSQATKFQTEFMGPVRVEEVTPSSEGILLRTDDSEVYLGSTALLATGVEYRRLKTRNLAAYMGRGVKYGSPSRKAVYDGQRVYVVGGANSAGQAAMHLSDFDACEVQLLVRGDSIEKGMSGYLVDRIMSRANISVRTNTELTGVDGYGDLEKVTLKSDGNTEEEPADRVFVLIGSVPKTGWLPDSIVIKDEQGFIVSGGDFSTEQRGEFVEKTKGRQPFAHETSTPGLFVAGDVRCGTNKRVALAVGDGAGVIPELHRYRDLHSKAK